MSIYLYVCEYGVAHIVYRKRVVHLYLVCIVYEYTSGKSASQYYICLHYILLLNSTTIYSCAAIYILQYVVIQATLTQSDVLLPMHLVIVMHKHIGILHIPSSSHITLLCGPTRHPPLCPANSHPLALRKHDKMKMKLIICIFYLILKTTTSIYYID
jgi:hypothetical protein